MREHLYRGKTFGGEWVEGVAMVLDDSARILTPPSIAGRIDGVDSFRILPETVGEWTGLTDDSLKQNKIFEGDIVSSNRDIFKVIFRDGMFELTNQNEDSRVSFWQVGHIEVIGNIYDNPELLGGSK